MDEQNTNPAPGTTVQPDATKIQTVGHTLEGSNGPVDSAYDHEASKQPSYAQKSEATTVRDISPVEAAHNGLFENQISLHDKLMLIAHRLESVLQRPFKGDEAIPTEDSYGSSPVALKLANSNSMTNASHNVADHILSNLEV
jgi:hypothetical protein